MKKFLALLLGSAVAVSAFAGLTACNPNGPSDKSHEGAADPRAADAYEVHGTDGTLVQSYSNLTAAIKAAVENDADLFEDKDTKDGALGSYVVRKGETTKVFLNRKTTGDAYYYYKDNSFIGWENYVTGVPNNRLNQSGWTTYNVNSGAVVNTATNGYAAYDGKGDLIPSSVADIGVSRGWEACHEYDASIQCTPVREAGAVGSRYVVDLSNVKITPPYKGVADKTYAYLGFLIGSGASTHDIGIACDTSTGVWYEYVMHDPFNNNTDAVKRTAEFNRGKAIMTSTWHEEGYFTPDLSSLTFYMMEEELEDDNGESYWTDHYTIYDDNSQFLYELYYDEAYINVDCPGAKFDNMNGFFFSAGLYIANDGEELDDAIAAKDYTNGSKFENLTIASSEVYIARSTDPAYEAYTKKTAINLDLSGWNDTRKATFNGKADEGYYNYTLVRNASCVDYTISADSKEVFSFAYDGDAVGETALSGQLKTMQDKVDSLKGVTAETVGNFAATISELGKAYAGGKAESSELVVYIYNAIDWQPYLDALKVKPTSPTDNLPEKLATFVTGFAALDLEDLYDLGAWKGFSPVSGQDGGGYILPKLEEVFGDRYDAWTGFSEEEKTLVKKALVTTYFEDYLDLYEAVNPLKTDNALFEVVGCDRTATTFTVNDTFVNMTKLELLKNFIDGVFYVNTAPKKADGADQYTGHVSEQGHLCCDDKYCIRNTFYTLYMEKQLEAAGVELDYVDGLMLALKNDGPVAGTNADPTLPNGGRVMLDFEYLWNVGKQIGRILRFECSYLDEELAEVINTYMVANEDGNGHWGTHQTFHNGTLCFGYYAAGGFTGAGGYAFPLFLLIDRDLYAANAADMSWKKAIAPLTEIIKRDASEDILVSPDTQTNNGLQPPMLVSEEVTAITAPVVDVNEVISDFTALELPSLDDITAWKGGGGTEKGYVQYEVGQFETVYKDYMRLTAEDQAKVKEELDWFEEWLTLYKQYKAIEKDVAKVDIPNTPDLSKTVNVFKINIANAFFNNLIGTWDENLAHPTKANLYGYLCMEHVDHRMSSLRGLYCYYWLKDHGIQFDFADKMLELACKFERSGLSKYTNLSETECAVKDFELLRAVGKQIARIVNGECTYLDKELADVVNEYLVADGTYDMPETGRFGCAESFYNLSLSDRYRNHNGDIMEEENRENNKWLYYINDTLGALNKTWAQLMSDYLIPILVRDTGDANIMVAPRNGSAPNGMVVAHKVTPVSGPQGA